MGKENWRGERHARSMIWAAGGLKIAAALCFVALVEGDEVGCVFALPPLICAVCFLFTKKRGWGIAGTAIYVLGKLIYVPWTLIACVMALAPLWAFPVHLALAVGLTVFFSYADEQAELLAAWEHEHREQEREEQDGQ